MAENMDPSDFNNRTSLDPRIAHLRHEVREIDLRLRGLLTERVFLSNRISEFERNGVQPPTKPAE